MIDESQIKGVDCNLLKEERIMPLEEGIQQIIYPVIHALFQRLGYFSKVRIRPNPDPLLQANGDRILSIEARPMTPEEIKKRDTPYKSKGPSS